MVGGTGGIRITALSILAIPQVWARMSTHPKWSKILIEGLVDINKEGIQASTAATTKLLKTYFKVRREYLAEQSQKTKDERKEFRQKLIREQQRITEQTFGFPERF